MKKIFIKAGILSFLWIGALKAQEVNTSKKLSFEEANFVTSYYDQNGNKSAISGGTGTEKLNDIGINFDVSFSLIDKKERKNTFKLDASLERYSSASSDNIDPETLSSASSSDMHFYPSLSWKIENEKKGNEFGLNVYYSTEYDYKSYGFGGSISKYFNQNQSNIGFNANILLDKIMVILPAELRPEGYPTGAEGDLDGMAYKPRNTYNFGLTFTQIINPRLHLLFMLDPAYQEGLLSTPFHRVYFNDKSLRVEKLPGERFKIPASIRANYFAGDNLILRSFYRFYKDTWDLAAHTAGLETPLKITPFFSIIPHYRFSHQKGTDYFKSFEESDPNATYFTSDHDLSSFQSHFAGLGFRAAPPEGIFSVSGIRSIEMRYGYYHRTTDLKSHIVSLMLKFQ